MFKHIEENITVNLNGISQIYETYQKKCFIEIKIDSPGITSIQCSFTNVILLFRICSYIHRRFKMYDISIIYNSIIFC